MKFKELSYKEQKEVGELLFRWLNMYTDEVINRVLPRVDEIISNEFTMMLLRELKERSEKNFSENLDSFVLFAAYKESDGGRQFERFSCITHPNSYRDVLYDMYIK